MERLSRKKTLNENDLAQYPIWVWDATKEYKVPMTVEYLNLEEHDTFFIKAKFKTSDHCFNGYLVGDDTYYSFTIFVGVFALKFNANANELNKVSLVRLFQMLDCKPFKFFPIEYESDVLLKGGRKISGILNFET